MHIRSRLGIQNGTCWIQREVRIGIMQLKGIIGKVKDCYNEEKTKKEDYILLDAPASVRWNRGKTNDITTLQSREYYKFPVIHLNCHCPDGGEHGTRNFS